MDGRKPKLRLYFVTEDDPLYVARFFETFFLEYPRNEFQISGITIQKAFNESRRATALRVLSLYGLAKFIRLSLRIIDRKVRRYSIASLARKEGIEIFQTLSVNEPDFVQRIRTLDPDVIVSVAAPEIFQRDLLESPRIGCINVHSGRLPTYRGMMPTFWQMRFGEPYVTVTVHEMAPKVDAGGVLGTVECDVKSGDTLDRVINETKEAGARLLIQVLRHLAAGKVEALPLDMSAAGYYSFPTRADVAEFRRRGHRLL
jgi:methionyl-tRNA formyltransferase